MRKTHGVTTRFEERENTTDQISCDESSCNVFLLLFVVLWVPISVMLCRRAVLMLWPAFLFLGLRFFLFSSLCLVAYAAFSCKKFLFLV
jgi:hypothetical protein